MADKPDLPLAAYIAGDAMNAFRDHVLDSIRLGETMVQAMHDAGQDKEWREQGLTEADLERAFQHLANAMKGVHEAFASVQSANLAAQKVAGMTFKMPNPGQPRDPAPRCCGGCNC